MGARLLLLALNVTSARLQAVWFKPSWSVLQVLSNSNDELVCFIPDILHVHAHNKESHGENYK